MVKELKLINRNTSPDITNETPFSGSSDIDFDASGNFVKISGQEALEQNVLKAVLTGVQLNGYGTEIFSLLGKKYIDSIRGKLLSEVISSLTKLKNNQLQYLQSEPNYDKNCVPSKVYNITTRKRSKTSLEISVQIRSLFQELTNDPNTQQINMILE